jgi:hypothetical protein
VRGSDQPKPSRSVDIHVVPQAAMERRRLEIKS